MKNSENLKFRESLKLLFVSVISKYRTNVIPPKLRLTVSFEFDAKLPFLEYLLCAQKTNEHFLSFLTACQQVVIMSPFQTREN